MDLQFLEVLIYFSERFDLLTLASHSISNMSLKTFVKLNSITNLTDARYGAGMYVNLLGFDLNKNSKNFISPALFGEIVGWVSGVELVGQFTHDSNPDLLETLKAYPSITWIEYDRLEELKMLVPSEYSLIYKVSLKEALRLEAEVTELLRELGILLHVFAPDRLLSEEDLVQIKKISEQCRVILGTGITAANVLSVADSTRIFGISLTGGEEVKPGLKEMDELADILEALEIEE